MEKTAGVHRAVLQTGQRTHATGQQTNTHGDEFRSKCEPGWVGLRGRRAGKRPCLHSHCWGSAGRPKSVRHAQSCGLQTSLALTNRPTWPGVDPSTWRTHTRQNRRQDEDRTWTPVPVPSALGEFGTLATAIRWDIRLRVRRNVQALSGHTATRVGAQTCQIQSGDTNDQTVSTGTRTHASRAQADLRTDVSFDPALSTVKQ